MSEGDVATCRRLVEAHIESLVVTRAVSKDEPVGEAECSQLLVDLQDLRALTADETTTLQLAVDTALRDLLLELVSSLVITDPNFLQVWYLLDLATVLADKELSEAASNFQLIEYLLDSQTVSGCRKVFDYLESRRDKLIACNFKAKSLVILRCCNELLRRLSRAEDTVFCGRVFIFLFQSFPLGDRSSVNLRGEFHVENVTLFDPAPKKSEDAIKPMEIDSERPASSGGQTPASTVPDTDTQKTGRSTPVSGRGKPDSKSTDAPPDLDTLFPQFWSLQALFSKPTRLFEPSAMSKFREGMSATLACFKSMSKNTSASSAAQSPPHGAKRKRSSDGTRVAQPYNPKYLTNRDLFDLEVHDLAFRRHILAQSLIMLDFLLSLSPAAKSKTQGLSNKAVAYSFTLSDEDSKYCQSMRQSIASYLQQQGPGNDGKMYFRMVDTVLSRDKNWARWKAESCPTIKRDPVEAEAYLATQKTLSAITEKRPFVNPPGAADFNFLSQTEPLDALKRPSKRHKVPSLKQYYETIEGAKLDLDFAADDDERRDLTEKIQGYLWRALRASALEGRRFTLCEKIKDGTNLKALIGEDEEPAAEAVDDQTAKDVAEPDAPGANGDGLNEAEAATDQVAFAQTSSASTPLPPGDGVEHVPDAAPAIPAAVAEETHAATAEVDAGEDDEFAPPGASDVDENQIDTEMSTAPTQSELESTEAEAENTAQGGQ